MAHNPEHVAEWFIRRAEKDGEYLSQMKVQKLVYIAHGWSLALRSKPLVSGSFEAWQWGPVMPSLYRRFARYGKHPIDPEDCFYTPDFSKDEEELLEAIWEVYRGFTAAQLSDMTHRSDTPWSRAYRTGVRGSVIPDQEIRDHYIELNQETAAVD